MRRRFSALSKKGNNPKGKAERVEPVELSITCPHVDEWNGRASLASIWVPGFLPSPISRSVSVRQPTQSQSICPRGVISGSADIRPIASWQPHAKCPLCFGTVPILIDKSRYLFLFSGPLEFTYAQVISDQVRWCVLVYQLGRYPAPLASRSPIGTKGTRITT